MRRASRRREYKNILVVRFSSLGDIVLTTPVLDALRRRFPNADLSFLLKEDFAKLLLGHPSGCEVISLPEAVRADSRAFVGFVDGLKKRHFDLVVDLQGNGRSFVVRNRLDTDFVKIKKHSILRIAIVKLKVGARRLPNIRKRFLEPLRRIGISSEEPPVVRLGFTDDELIAVRERFLRSIDNSRPFAVVHPGSKWPLKEWGSKRFESLAEALVAQGFTVGVFGSASVEKANIVHLPKTTIREMIALIAISDVFIGNDSGPLHVAEAVGTPSVGIFGPTSEALGYSSQWRGAAVVGVELKCRPCSLYGRGKCSTGGHECMENITVEMVLEAALKQYRWGVKNHAEKGG